MLKDVEENKKKQKAKAALDTASAHGCAADILEITIPACSASTSRPFGMSIANRGMATSNCYQTNGVSPKKKGKCKPMK